MPITPERVAKLRAYGLSEYASRTYLALLDLGTAEARDISGISKVPASKIYRILEQLHEKGLVDILPEFPRKYAPVPFRDFMDKLHQEHQATAAAIAAERDSLARMFAVMGDVESSDRGGFTVLRGRRNVMEKLDEMARSVKRSLLVLATTGLAERGDALADLVRPAAEVGARVRIIVPDSVEHPESAPWAALGEARTAPAHLLASGGAVLVVDGTRGLLVQFVPDDGHTLDGNDVAVATNQPGVVSIIETLALWPWEAGRPVQPARDVPILDHERRADGEAVGVAR